MVRGHHDACVGLARGFGQRGVTHFARCRFDAAPAPLHFDMADDQRNAATRAFGFAMRHPGVGIAAQPMVHMNRYDTPNASAARCHQAREEIEQCHRVAATAQPECNGCGGARRGV